MKGNVLYVFCALALANVRGTNDLGDAKYLCSSADSDGQLIPHEECNKFYKCSERAAVTITCPVNLLYNSDFEICDWPENVECGSRTIENNKPGDGNENNPPAETDKPSINTDPSQAVDICAAAGSDGILIAHKDCDKFYKCSEGKPVAINCPLNLLYNSEKEYCDWPENVKCEAPKDQDKDKPVVEETKNPPGNADPSQAEKICAQADSDGVLIAHKDCHKFYKCSEGKAVTLSCPINLLYNPEMEYCDWPDNVQCGSKIVNKKKIQYVAVYKLPVKPLSNSDPSQAQAICAKLESDGTLVAHEDCSKFYKCSEQKPVAQSCPLDLLYNPEKEYCDWPANVECKQLELQPETQPEEDKNEDKNEEITDNENKPAGNIDPTLAPEICAVSGSDGILVAHEDCDKFYKCSKGKPVAMSCGPNLLYNAEKEYCDWPQNVKCKVDVTHEVFNAKPPASKVAKPFGNSDPNQAKDICASEESDGVLVAHEDCDKFYKCSEGKPVVLVCPLNLLYNSDLEYCDWPENVQCKSSNTEDKEQDKEKPVVDNENKPTDNSNANNIAQICAAPNSERLLIAHKDCTKFYKCVEGKPVVVSCPTHLHFNAEKEYCDWPENVECKYVNIEETEDNVEEKEKEQEKPVSGGDKPNDMCTAPDSDGELVAHADCDKFYMCSEGKPVTMYCPQNLLYNPTVSYCDWPYNVDCGNRKKSS
ncbi:chondroitin proteoglycan 2-like [Pectinophora gossypiella]|uniref:chondroitin proteoglycan 2-like n=1 Tax=Pectinophora gossypiella TaxID=13191 RepID=UPI00214EB531|nr:chondroitin proteoglycan 2-like [Pectinophora gossypiella]